MFLKFIAAILSVFIAVQPARSGEQPASKIVQSRGRDFTVGGKVVPLIGINRYELAGGPQAGSCQHWGGRDVWWAWSKGIIDATSAMGGNVIRLWAFQNYAGPSGKDFSYLDKVIAYAREKRVRLIMTLENNWGDCTQGGIKESKWYRDGYKGRYGYPLSFVDYIKAIVPRYKDEPAIAMWQIINEAKNYQEPQVLRQFIVDTAKLIKSLDKKHLVSSGGAIQCWQGEQGAKDFKSYADDLNVDVLDMHDYDEVSTPLPVCLQRALSAAKQLNKPLIVGEAGVPAQGYSAESRSHHFSNKMMAAAKAGAAGYLIWSLNLPGEKNLDGFDFSPKDASAKALANARQKWLRD